MIVRNISRPIRRFAVGAAAALTLAMLPVLLDGASSRAFAAAATPAVATMMAAVQPEAQPFHLTGIRTHRPRFAPFRSRAQARITAAHAALLAGVLTVLAGFNLAFFSHIARAYPPDCRAAARRCA